MRPSLISGDSGDGGEWGTLGSEGGVGGRGDWGNCCEEDRQDNELSLEKGFRLLSVYYDRNSTKFWIITEGDRAVTTILLPSEY